MSFFYVYVYTVHVLEYLENCIDHQLWVVSGIKLDLDYTYLGG